MNIYLSQIFMVIFLLTAGNNSFAQQTNEKASTRAIIFRDTAGLLAFDSVHHTLPVVTQAGNFSIIKHFKNISSRPVIIDQVFTSDPHFICDYPREPIIPGKTYAFKICFTFGSGSAFNYHWRKTMGFVLSDSTRIPLQFEGEVMAK